MGKVLEFYYRGALHYVVAAFVAYPTHTLNEPLCLFLNTFVSLEITNLVQVSIHKRARHRIQRRPARSGPHPRARGRRGAQRVPPRPRRREHHPPAEQVEP